MTHGSPIYSQPIPMTGFRSLRVEARPGPEPGAAPGSASVRVLGTQDEEDAKKTWVVKGGAIDIQAGQAMVAEFENLGRFARVEAQPVGGQGRIEIRVVRLP